MADLTYADLETLTYVGLSDYSLQRTGTTSDMTYEDLEGLTYGGLSDYAFQNVSDSIPTNGSHDCRTSNALELRRAR